jgi:membrane associated rhomboid family serine protease
VELHPLIALSLLAAVAAVLLTRVRRAGKRGLAFAAMLAVPAALALVALRPSPWREAALYASVTGVAVLVLLPHLLLWLARRALRARELGRALPLLRARAALQPGVSTADRDLCAELVALAAGAREPAEVLRAERLQAPIDLGLRVVLLEAIILALTARGEHRAAIELFLREGAEAIAAVSPAVIRAVAHAFEAVGDHERAAHLQAIASELGPGGRARARLLRTTPLTIALMLLLAAVHLALTIQGASDDGFTLMRFGANLRAATLHGEPWRLLGAIFLHGGLLHLASNLYGLYALGRLVEQLFGSLRMLVIFVAAGAAGSVASAIWGEAARMSVGASGAVFGLLGAALAIMLRLRGVFPEAWRRQVMFNLLVVIALNLYIGYSVKMVDNAAHMGGLAGGALLGLLLVPTREGPGAVARALLRGAAAALCAACLASAALTAYTRPAETLARIPTRDEVRAGVAARLPLHFLVANEKGFLIFEPLVFGLALEATVDRLDPGLPFERIATDQIALLRKRLAEDASIRSEPSSLALEVGPALARAEARVARGPAGPMRHLVWLRTEGEVVLGLEVVVPERRVEDYRALLERVAASLRYRPSRAATSSRVGAAGQGP